MAYVLSQKLLDRIHDDLNRGETTALQPQYQAPSASSHEVPIAADNTRYGWFALTDSLTLTGEAEMVSCRLAPCPDGSPYQSGYTLEPKFTGKPRKVYDLLWRCTTQVPAGSLVFCEKINGVWAFRECVNTTTYGSADFAPITSSLPTGDPQCQFVGKTTSAWAKGTTHDVEIYYQSGTSWSVLTATAVGATAATNVTVNCHNRYADIDSGKWVRVTGGGELVTVEC